MDLEITKFSNGKQTTEFLQIQTMNNQFHPKSILLVKKSEMTENGHKIENLEIKKVQFLANCKTKFENELLVAFYISDEGVLTGHIISDLPNEYSAENAHLVDYQSYLEICNLTNEKTLSFLEYFEEIKNSYVGINTFSKFKEKYYNYTDQKEMWGLVEN